MVSLSEAFSGVHGDVVRDPRTAESSDFANKDSHGVLQCNYTRISCQRFSL